jgi:DNA-binding NtrC family response regulator
MFEAAQGGTIFLDEIGDLSLAAQAKILRVLQERAVDRIGGRATVPIDVRVIAATNRNLETSMGEKQFRADLYFRLSVVRIQTPSLREIPEDIPVLANHFLQKHCAAMALEPKQFTEDALARMAAYNWPGNTRELENEIKRALASVRGKTIDADQLAIRRDPPAPKRATTSPPETSRSLYEAVEALERRMIEDALASSGGNKLKAAQRLGLSRQGLFKKLKKLGVPS